MRVRDHSVSPNQILHKCDHISRWKGGLPYYWYTLIISQFSSHQSHYLNRWGTGTKLSAFKLKRSSEAQRKTQMREQRQQSLDPEKHPLLFNGNKFTSWIRATSVPSMDALNWKRKGNQVQTTKHETTKLKNRNQTYGNSLRIQEIFFVSHQHSNSRLKNHES